MITGFNTDVQHKGVTYHVQTEDKGLDSPLILSLVYVGGAIIASKRTPYEDLVGKGFDEQALTERLQRQHKLICAAIKAGRVEDLKRMGTPNGGATQPETEPRDDAASPAGRKPSAVRRKRDEVAPPPVAAAPPAVVDALPAVVEAEAQAVVAAPQAAEGAAIPILEVIPAPEPEESPLALVELLPAESEATLQAARGVSKAEPEIVILTTLSDEISALGDFVPRAEPKPENPPETRLHTQAPAMPTVEATGAASGAAVAGAGQDLSDDIYLSLLDDEGEFRAGQLVTIKVYVGRGTYGQRAQADASVTVKVLGTSFRPIIMNATTDALGVGVVRALLPHFTSGRAAIIIRAASGDDSAEMRRIIHQ